MRRILNNMLYGLQRKKRRGQAMVELALSLPLLLAVLAGVIELSVLISHASSLQVAVDLSARSAAAKKCTIENVKKRITDILANDRLLNPKDLDIEVEESIDFNGSPTLTVTAWLKVSPFAFTNMGTFSLHSTATYRKEWPEPMR